MNLNERKLKRILRENKISRSALKRRIIVEAKIHQYNSLYKKNLIEMADNIIESEKLMHYNGYDQYQINLNSMKIARRYENINMALKEGILDGVLDAGGFALSRVGGGSIDALKQSLIEIVLEFFNVDVKSPLGRIIVNALENIELTNISKYFKADSCKEIANLIHNSLSEALMEFLSEKFDLPYPLARKGLTGATFQEAIMTIINDDLLPVLNLKMSEYVCQIDMTGLSKKLKAIVGSSGGLSKSSSTRSSDSGLSKKSS